MATVLFSMSIFRYLEVEEDHSGESTIDFNAKLYVSGLLMSVKSSGRFTPHD